MFIGRSGGIAALVTMLVVFGWAAWDGRALFGLAWICVLLLFGGLVWWDSWRRTRL